MASLAGMRDNGELHIDPEVWRKFDLSLKRVLRDRGADSDAELPILIVLEQAPVAGPAPVGPAREHWLAEQERAFEEASAAVRQTIAEAGPYEIQTSWLARTVGARLPSRVLDRIARRPEVRQIILDARRKLITEQEGRDA